MVDVWTSWIAVAPGFVAIAGALAWTRRLWPARIVVLVALVWIGLAVLLFGGALVL